MDEQIKYNMAQPDIWKRIFFMLIFAAVENLNRMLIWAVTLFQVVTVLLTGNSNDNLLNFGRSLSVYNYHIMLFLTFSTEVLPFPFSTWNQTADLKTTTVAKLETE